jgi:heme/copper-type cytochrome/quinol oxidase subunit 2
MNAILLISFCLGNIIGPLTFRAGDAPEYTPAKITIIVTCAVAVVLVLILRTYYMWENKRRDKLAEATHVEHQVNIEFADVTDRKNKEFRYRL